jgi:hypothetical protein
LIWIVRWLLLQEGLAECIANEDGERQIACAISFHGEETARLSCFKFPVPLVIYTQGEIYSILGMKQNHNS